MVDGRIPISDIAALLESWAESSARWCGSGPDDKWIIDSLLAAHLGINLVCGSLRNTLAWRMELEIT